jgi:penicillin-binding protein 1A
MTTLEMAAAYATFPNNGDYREPYAYTKVLDGDGNVVLETRPISVEVYSDETAYIMSDILKGVITGGTATGHVNTITNANGESIAVAGKTGTTEVDIKDIRDKWFCGFTPYYAAAVWYGYDNSLRVTAVPKIDQYCAQNIWDFVMQKIHTNLPGADFVMPEGVVSRTVCKDSGQLATQFCKDAGSAITDYFIAGAYLTPTEDCTFHIAPTPTPTPPPEPTEPSVVP